MIIGIPIYDAVDLLDVAAPREIFNAMKEHRPDFDIWLLAPNCNDIVTRDGMTIKPQKTFEEVPNVDVLWVPGGDPVALKAIINDPERTYLDYFISSTENAQWITSVCEGALLLAAAGLLYGYEATTHGAFVPCLQAYP